MIITIIIIVISSSSNGGGGGNHFSLGAKVFSILRPDGAAPSPRSSPSPSPSSSAGIFLQQRQVLGSERAEGEGALEARSLTDRLAGRRQVARPAPVWALLHEWRAALQVGAGRGPRNQMNESMAAWACEWCAGRQEACSAGGCRPEYKSIWARPCLSIGPNHSITLPAHQVSPPRRRHHLRLLYTETSASFGRQTHMNAQAAATQL